MQSDPRFDLYSFSIRPSTANALDFLDAPARLVEALSDFSVTMRWFVQAFQTTGKLSLNLLARSAAVVLRGLGRITGGGFLEAMAGFITELNDLFGGFKERAKLVEHALRSPQVAFVLVTSPAPMSIQEVLFFSDRLDAANMARGAFVVNRFRMAPPGASSTIGEKEVADALAKRGVVLEERAPERLVQAYRDAVRLAALDTLHVKDMAARANGRVPVVRVPELASDVHDLKHLVAISKMLTTGGI